ncbi:MAG TPA: HAD-IA family hydrolase [Bryobacteraceae bacterium]|nr:HAD-IA family hydrolase [Bryobacteraceae bacterium]
MIPRFPVYLFDIDGTLLDSARDICGAIQQVLANRNRTDIPFEFLKSYVGLHLVSCFGDVFPGHSAEQMEEMVQEYRSLYHARGHKLTTVFPGVKEALPLLGGRKATATTKGTPTTRLVLELFGLIQYFDHVQGTDGFPSKPAPDVILTSLKAMEACPDDCLMVGDSPADMEAARRAGVKVCAVRYGYGKPEELARWEPDFWISDLRELLS